MKFKKLILLGSVVASMMVMSQSAFANQSSNFFKVYTLCFACECDVNYWIKDGDSFDSSILITRDGKLLKNGVVIEKGTKEYQETIKKLKDLDKNFDLQFGKFSL